MRKLLKFLPAIALVGVAIYFILTTTPSVRYWVDDLCSATLLRNNGYFAAQLAWWKSWTGRYSYIAFLDLFESFGPWVVRVLPVLLYAFLLISFRRIGWLFSAIFATLALVNAPNVIQTFYWQTGAFNYVAPFIFFNFALTIVFLRHMATYPYLALVLVFIAGGFSEAYAAPQLIFFVIVFLTLKYTALGKRQRTHRAVLFAILGALLSLIVMSLSPGNTARTATVSQMTHFVDLFKSSLLGTKWYMLRMLTVKPFIYSLVIIFTSAYLFAKRLIVSKRDAIVVMALSILTAIFTSMAAITVGFYTTGIILPERALFVPVYFMLLSFLAFSFGLRGYIETTLAKKAKSWFWWGTVLMNLIFVALLISSIIPHWLCKKGST